MAIAGHTFLARLGKKRLRPGGIEATEWLLEKANINKDKKILEVACNMGTTMIGVSKKYGCEIVGVDLDSKALEEAKKNIALNNLEDKITIFKANALKLPFEDNTFDVVINEAMLTMLPYQKKLEAVKEYYRVLKPGGCLLTHDVMLTEKNDFVVKKLQKAINVQAEPLEKNEWEKVFLNADFNKIEVKNGKMSLLSPSGLVKDEGFLGTIKIIKNAFKKENIEMFKEMFKVFKNNKKTLNYIAVYSVK